MKLKQIYLFFLICFICQSCGNKKRIDVSNISLNIKIERFDQELDSVNATNIAQKTTALGDKYPWFYEDYMGQMLGVGSPADPIYTSNLSSVLNNPDYLDLKNTVRETFPDLSVYESELTDAFRHIRYYYPKQKIPRLISFVSGFAVQTPIGNNYMGIGLDMFLGKNGSKYYPALRQSIPQYISRRFTPENITPRTIEAFLREEMFPEQDADQSLLARMIHHGKILYAMDSFMPELADTLKIGYTEAQLSWCKENEGGIWAYFLENELLFNSDYMKIQKYLTEAPFTPGLGENSESAPKLAVWTGWQIVRKYMDKHPDISLVQLMQEKDSQKILNESSYKPKL